MLLPRFSTHLQRTQDLTPAFKSFFPNKSFELRNKIAAFIGKQRLCFLGGGAHQSELCKCLADLSLS